MTSFVTTSDLQKAVSALSAVAKTAGTLPILHYIHADLFATGMRLRATNMQVELEVFVPVIDGPQETHTFDIPAELLARTCKGLRQQRTPISLVGSIFTAGAVGIGVRIDTQDDESAFPAPMPFEKGAKFATTLAKTFIAAMDRTQKFASPDPTKPTLSCVLIEKDKLVATDGFILAVEPVKFFDFEAIQGSPNARGDKQGILIGKEPWKLLKAALKGEDGTLMIQNDSVTINEHTATFGLVTFSVPGMRFTARNTEGNYPAYYKVIPSSFAREVKLPRKELLAALKEVGALKDDYNKNASLFMSAEGVEAVFKHPDNGTAKSMVRLEGMPQQRFTFNLDHLERIFSSYPGDEVPFQWNTVVAVCQLGNAYIMPVRYADDPPVDYATGEEKKEESHDETPAAS